MTARRLGAAGLAAALLACVALPASAMQVTATFTGVVVWPGGVADVGDPISGTFRFDLDAPELPGTVDDPSRGWYVSQGPGTLSVQIGSYSGFDDFLTLQVEHSSVRDFFNVFAGVLKGDTIGGHAPREFRLQIMDPTGTAIDSDALPFPAPDLADFTTENINTSFITLNASTGQMRGRVESLVFAIPEPSRAGLVAMAVWLGLAVRRRQSSSPRPQRMPRRSSS